MFTSRGQTFHEKDKELKNHEEHLQAQASHFLRFCNVPEFVENNKEIWCEYNIAPLFDGKLEVKGKGMMTQLLYTKVCDTVDLVESGAPYDPKLNISLLDRLVKLGELRAPLEDACLEYHAKEERLVLDMTLNLTHLDALIGWKIASKIKRVHEVVAYPVVLHAPIREASLDDMHVYIRFTGEKLMKGVTISELSNTSARNILDDSFEHESPKPTRRQDDDDGGSVFSRGSSSIRDRLIGSFSTRFGLDRGKKDREEILLRRTRPSVTHLADELSHYSSTDAAKVKSKETSEEEEEVEVLPETKHMTDVEKENEAFVKEMYLSNPKYTTWKQPLPIPKDPISLLKEFAERPDQKLLIHYTAERRPGWAMPFFDATCKVTSAHAAEEPPPTLYQGSGSGFRITEARRAAAQEVLLNLSNRGLLSQSEWNASMMDPPPY